MGVPLNHPFIVGFSIINQPAIGDPPWLTPMYWYLNSLCQIFYSSHLVGGIRTAATTLCFFPILWNTSALAQCHGDTPSIAFPRYIHWWLRVPLTANEWSPCELQAQKR